MSYSVTKLIAESFYTSGIVSRQFQTVAGDQEQTAFDALNEILTDTVIEDDMIPYYTTRYDFPLVASQERYFIPGLTHCETITFFIDTVRYQMYLTQKDRFFGSGRAENVTSLPFNYNCERVPGGMNIFLYFRPERCFPAQITGWFALRSVSLYQDLMSPLAFADLGVPSVMGTGTLNPRELVINGIDLAGTYATPQALVNFINTMPPIPYVSAAITGGRFILSNRSNGNINVSTSGNQGFVNNLTFTGFSTTNGPLNQTFMAQSLDQFYINYLQYRLAERLCTKYNFIVPEGCATQLLMYKQMISKRSAPLDLSIHKVSTMTRHYAINYGQVNWGRGWTTPW